VHLPFAARIVGSIAARVFITFGLTVLSAVLVALVSLSATRDATRRLEQLQDTQQRLSTALKELELGAERENDGVQAYLLSGDERYLQDQAEGQRRFEQAFLDLEGLTDADAGLDRLDAIYLANQRFENSAASQLALYRQNWQRSAIFLWRTEGQDTKRLLEERISDYREWYESTTLADIAAARDAGGRAMLLAVVLILLTAAGSLALGLNLTRSLSRRLGALTMAARAIERDDLTARAVVAGQDEVTELAAAMNRMAEHLETSQRELEESRRRLAQSLEEFRLLSENANDIVYALDVDGCYRYVNPAIEHIAGYRPSEVVGRHFSEFLPEEIRTAQSESFARRMRGEEVSDTAEIEYLGKGGRLVPLDLRIGTVHRDGQIVGMQGIARDVTQRKAMEAQIRQLAEQEHQRAEQLQEVARVGQTIARLASLDELLPKIAGLLHEVFGYERVAIFLLDAESRLSSLRASAGDYAALGPVPFSVSEDQGVVGWVAAHGEPLRLGDVRGDPRYLEIPATAGTRSELAVPIRAAGEVLGVVNLESREPDHFDANDEATLIILADQIATAIQNARLFEQQHGLAVADERNRLAREIHDTLAQGLTAITLQLEVADALLDVGTEQARPMIIKALELTRANLEEARRSVMDLRAAPLQGRDLPGALEELVSGFGREHGLRADFMTRNVSGRLPAAVEAGLYRIAQEALNNVLKHAQASTVHLTLARADDTLLLVIEDDGRGIDPATSRPDRRNGGFGLIGMQERARLLGGELQIVSEPGAGTRVEVEVVVPSRRESAVAAGRT
jgi:two-component system, NarL family, sensor kinase